MTDGTKLNLKGPATHRVKTDDGATIAVWDSGEVEKNPIVFVHGFPENRYCWEPVVQILSNKKDLNKFRFIVYDLRGFGESSKNGEASWQRMVKDHLEVSKQLGLKRYHLMGHDWGAGVALHLARLAPEELLSCCILNTTFWKVDFLGMWHMLFFNLPLIPKYMLKRFPEYCFDKVFGIAFNQLDRLGGDAKNSYLKMFRDKETVDFWTELYRNLFKTVTSAVLPLPKFIQRKVAGSSVLLPKQSKYAYKIPFSIIWGIDDTFCPLSIGKVIEKNLKRRGATVKFYEIRDSGHFVTEEQPIETATLIEQHLLEFDEKLVQA